MTMSVEILVVLPWFRIHRRFCLPFETECSTKKRLGVQSFYFVKSAEFPCACVVESILCVYVCLVYSCVLQRASVKGLAWR